MEPITLTRTNWQYLLELSTHTDQGTAERIAGVAITERDFDTNEFLALRLKLFAGIESGLEAEKLHALSEESEDGKEPTSITIDLTAGEMLFLEMSMSATSWQGAIQTQHALRAGILRLVARHRTGREMGT